MVAMTFSMVAKVLISFQLVPSMLLGGTNDIPAGCNGVAMWQY